MSEIGELLQRHILGRVNLAADHLRSINSLLRTAATFAENVPATDHDHLAEDLRELIDRRVSDQTTQFVNPFTWDEIETHLREKGWKM